MFRRRQEPEPPETGSLRQDAGSRNGLEFAVRGGPEDGGGGMGAVYLAKDRNLGDAREPSRKWSNLIWTSRNMKRR